MRRLWRFLIDGCWHDFLAVKVFHYRDTSWLQEGKRGTPSTEVTFQCIKCCKIFTQNLYGAGFLELEELNK